MANSVSIIKFYENFANFILITKLKNKKLKSAKMYM